MEKCWETIIENSWSNWVICSIFSTLKLSTVCDLQTIICEIPTKLLLSVTKDCCKSNLSIYFTNLSATSQQQSRLYYVESLRLEWLNNIKIIYDCKLYRRMQASAYATLCKKNGAIYQYTISAKSVKKAEKFFDAIQKLVF